MTAGGLTFDRIDEESGLVQVGGARGTPTELAERGFVATFPEGFGQLPDGTLRAGEQIGLRFSAAALTSRAIPRIASGLTGRVRIEFYERPARRPRTWIACRSPTIMRLTSIELPP